MKLGYTKKVNLTVGLAFLMGPIIVASIVMVPAILAQLWLLGTLIVVAQVLFIIGCCLYAKGKGHHPALGLLGLLYIPGLIVLAFFPDKHKGEDTNTGCFSTLLFLLVALVLIFGPIIFYISKAVKGRSTSGNIGQQQDKLKESIAKLNVTVLTSSYSDLGTRVKAMDSLNKEGEAGREQLRNVLVLLKQKTNPTQDDSILMRQIEDALRATSTDSPANGLSNSTIASEIKVIKMTFTTGIDNSNMPVDDLNHISIQQRKVFMHIKLQIPPEKTYQFTGKLYDAAGKLVLNHTMPMYPKESIWYPWFFHNFDKAVDAPGIWRFSFFVDGKQLAEQQLKVDAL